MKPEVVSVPCSFLDSVALHLSLVEFKLLPLIDGLYCDAERAVEHPHGPYRTFNMNCREAFIIADQMGEVIDSARSLLNALERHVKRT